MNSSVDLILGNKLQSASSDQLSIPNISTNLPSFKPGSSSLQSAPPIERSDFNSANVNIGISDRSIFEAVSTKLSYYNTKRNSLSLSPPSSQLNSPVERIPPANRILDPLNLANIYHHPSPDFLSPMNNVVLSPGAHSIPLHHTGSGFNGHLNLGVSDQTIFEEVSKKIKNTHTSSPLSASYIHTPQPGSGAPPPSLPIAPSICEEFEHQESQFNAIIESKLKHVSTNQGTTDETISEACQNFETSRSRNLNKQESCPPNLKLNPNRPILEKTPLEMEDEPKTITILNGYRKRKLLWNPSDNKSDHIPKPEAYEEICLNFGRKVRFENSVLGSFTKDYYIKPPFLFHDRKSDQNISHLTTSKWLQRLADQCHLHGNVSHTHMEVLANKLMAMIYESQTQVNKLYQLLDEINMKYVIEPQPSIENAKETTESQYDVKLEYFLAEKLLSTIIRKEDLIEQLTSIRIHLVKGIQLNEQLFKKIKKYRTGYQRAKKEHSTMVYVESHNNKISEGQPRKSKASERKKRLRRDKGDKTSS